MAAEKNGTEGGGSNGKDCSRNVCMCLKVAVVVGWWLLSARVEGANASDSRT